MAATAETESKPAAATATADTLTLNEKAIDAARRGLDHGAVTPSFGPWRTQIVDLLNGALATELVCVLRYRRHHYMAKGLASPRIAEEFLAHSHAELGHADRLARRIVQLAGEPDFHPDTLSKRSHAAYDASFDLREMLKANLIAERVAIETYSQMINLIDTKDITTRRLLEDILSDEQQHADGLKDWLAD